MLFEKIAPIVILLTLIISALVAVKIKKSSLFTIDGAFALFGTFLGLLISFMNLIYSNNYLISIGPLLIIASVLYLRFRNELLADNIDLNLNFSNSTLKIIQIIYWICILIISVSYFQAEPYERPLIFFAGISVAVASLTLEILSHLYEKEVQVYRLIFKILILSLILRFSAYFVSPYPVGSDPWRHADLIKSISIYGTSYLPTLNSYYSYYPMMHIYASILSLLGNLSTRDAMLLIGAILPISSIFVYILVKKITNSVQLGLFSMLLLNFSDFHIEWSIELIAMSFGIAIYTILIYFLIERKEKTSIFFKTFTILFIFIITWTHTVSTFIFIVSIISLFAGSYIYEYIYLIKHDPIKLTVNITLCILSIIILVYHWLDPEYPFFELIINELINSLSTEAEFLGRSTISNVGDSWSSILNILGFLILIFFGILGSLYSLSKEYQDKTKISLIFMLVVLFSIFFIFPVMGMRNIMPFRWPAFIYITFVLFSGIGIFKIVNVINSRLHKTIFLSLIIVVFSFSMITNSVTNMDSPIYGSNLNQKVIWTESEIEMCKHITNYYDGVIVTDTQTCVNVFRTYLNRDKVAEYPATLQGELDWEYLENRIIIWRKVSLERPVQAQYLSESPDILLGPEFKYKLDNTYCSIYDNREAELYLGISKK